MATTGRTGRTGRIGQATSEERRRVLGHVAHEIVSRADPSRPTRVAVDGITAAGKTTFADDLAAVLRAAGAGCCG